MTNNNRLILVCNDDGVTAPGIEALIDVVKPMGDVWVIAPDKPQSGMGHAITINATLRVRKVREEENLHVFACSGTPVDCVKLAVNTILPKKPDIVVSGINHGSNASINVIYSGTMSAAVEGALEGVPSVGFSLLDHSIEANFNASKHFAEIIIKNMLQNTMPDGVCLNVNIPNISIDAIQGIKVCRQARANWEEEFDARIDPSGNPYYWLTGVFKNYDQGTDTDIWALDNQYVSVTPVQFDMTAHQFIAQLNSWNFNV